MMKTVFPSLIIFPTQRPRLYVSVLLALFLLFWALTSPTLAAAQDVTPDVTPEVTPEAPDLLLDQPFDEPIVDVPTDTAPVFTPPAPSEVINGVILSLFALFASGIASPLTSPIVSIVKRLPFFGDYIGSDELGNPKPRFTGDQLNLGVAMLLSVVSWGAASLGFAGQLDTVYRLIFSVLPVLFGAGGNFVGNQSVFKFGQHWSIPILGYTRSNPHALIEAIGDDDLITI